MSEKPIDKLETQLETLIESAFARLFRRTINARDVAVLIVREMEDHLREPADNDPRPIAPDAYVIYLNAKTVKHFLKSYPDLSKRLSALIVDLSTQSGYRLPTKPTVKLLADGQLSAHKAIITAEHSSEIQASTEAMYDDDGGIEDVMETVRLTEDEIDDLPYENLERELDDYEEISDEELDILDEYDELFDLVDIDDTDELLDYLDEFGDDDLFEFLDEELDIEYFDGDMADNVKLVRDTVTTVHIAGYTGNIEGFTAGITFDKGNHFGCNFTFVHQTSDAQRPLQAK